jgi:RNA polymerase sigma factor (sigma-70 family)
MIHGNPKSVGEQLEVLWTSGTLTGMTDAQLVGRFAGVRDATSESVFRELMHRHGPMVMGVCRQILGQRHDADDAFQATFLVLVRKARSIRVGESLAPWLYTVAYRTAQRARATRSRYRFAPVENLEDPMESPTDGACHFDMRPWLHEELNRLPGKYRDPIVLCHLEGKTHEEAARLLHWPVGTVSGRLSRGRELLRARLRRRGLDVSPAVLAAHWLAGTPTGVALPLIESTVGAAIGSAAPAISASVLTLTQGVLNAMLVNKIKMTALIVMVVGGVTASAGVWAIQTSRGSNRPDQAEKATRPEVDLKVGGPSQGTAPFKKVQAKALVESTQEAGPDMGSSFKAGRLKNYPNIDLRRALPGIRTQSMVLVQSPDRTAWEGMSLELDHPRWNRIRLSPETTAEPIWLSDIAALRVKGKQIDRVAAFSPYTGDWVGQNLLKPVSDEITPLVGLGWALYQAGNDFYAFSSRRGSWAVLDLKGDEPASVAFSEGDIEIMQGNRLYVFALKQGEWSEPVEVYAPPQAASSKGQ